MKSNSVGTRSNRVRFGKRFSSVILLLVALVGGFGIAEAQTTPGTKSQPTITVTPPSAAPPTVFNTPVPQKAAPVVVPPTTVTQAIAPAAPKFDGKQLYRKAFELVRDHHLYLQLLPKAERDAWLKEWENKFGAVGNTQLDSEKGADEAVQLLMWSLGQRFDYFFDVEATTGEKNTTDPSLTGIGVQLRLTNLKSIIENLQKTNPHAMRKDLDAAMIVSNDNRIEIMRPLEDGPSEKLLKKGDAIVKIDGVALAGQVFGEAIKGLRGAEDSTVEVTVDRPGVGEVSFTITRKKFIPHVVHATDLGNGITHIALENFVSNHGPKEMRDALVQAAKGRGIIIDLRDNGGGNLQYVLTMLGYMIPEGTVMVTKNRQAGTETIYERRVIFNDGFATTVTSDGQDPPNLQITPSARPPLIVPASMPIVVITNNNSASASEIMSGALQQLKNSTVVGKATHGKGVGQTVLDLPFGRRLHVTSFEFYPSGKKIDWQGVLPNVEVEQADDDGRTDNQLKAALDSITQQLTALEARDKKAQELEKENRDEFKKTLDERKKRFSAPATSPSPAPVAPVKKP